MKMPLFLEAQDVQQEPVAPSVVVAIGEFGRQVLAALSGPAALRHGLANTHAVWAGPGGWATGGDDGPAPWAEPDASVWQPGDQWWQDHGSRGLRLLQQAVERAQMGAVSDEQPLDLYIVGHLQEGAVQALWPKVLAAARAAAIPFSEHLFTLIFATDSRTFGQLPVEEAEALHATLAALAVELEAATDHHEQQGGIGWCYLVDTVNANGYPLRPVAYLECTPDVLQAQTIAEFIAQLAGGLRQTESYRRLNLAWLQRDSRAAEAEARVGSFAAGSLLFPVEALSEQARDGLARRLLADHIAGPDRPGDLPAARLLRTRWLAAHSLAPADLRRDITHDDGGHPILFSLEPPQLRLIYDDDPERLPDALWNWDQILWQRWVHEEGPPRRMRGSARRRLDEISRWLDETLAALLDQEVGGLRQAGHFVREAEMAVQMEREQSEEATGGSWLALLLSAVRRRPDPTVMPDLEEARRRLEQALSRRVNRRAVWTRASVLSAVLLGFAWVAYLAADETLGLHGLAARHVGLEAAGLAAALDLLVVTALCWLAMLLAAWTTIYRSERAVIRAAERMVDDTQQKYRALMERTLRQEREGVYSGVLSAIGAWRERVERHRQAIAAATDRLEEDLARRPEINLLLTERLLLRPEQWTGHLPEPDRETEAEMAVEFLAEADGGRWRAGSEEEFLAAVRAYAGQRLRLWRSQLARTPWIVSRDAPEAARSLVTELSQTLRPAWPLDREERVAATMGSARPASNGRQHGAARMVAFVGFPPAAGADGSTGANSRAVAFQSGELGRLTYAATVHNLPLRDLRLWQTLTGGYCPDGDEGDRVDADTPATPIAEPAS